MVIRISIVRVSKERVSRRTNKQNEHGNNEDVLMRICTHCLLTNGVVDPNLYMDRVLLEAKRRAMYGHGEETLCATKI